MKKLMIAAAMVCAAACVQASSVTWGVGGIRDSSANVEGTYTVYYLMSADDTGAAAAKLLSVEAAIAAVNGRDATTLANHSIPEAKTTAYDEGEPRAANSARVDTYKSQWVSPDAQNMKYGSFYAIVINDTDIKAATEYMLIGPKDAAFGTEDSKINVPLSASSASWTAIQSVPEPTSGLLLLLGVAGLALRRRRA